MFGGGEARAERGSEGQRDGCACLLACLLSTLSCPPTPPAHHTPVCACLYLYLSVLQVGNFRVEPPGLFRGRGEHPKMGRLKKRIYPGDITINISADAPVPEHPFPGGGYERAGGRAASGAVPPAS